MIQSFSTLFDIHTAGGIPPAENYGPWIFAIVVTSVFATVVMIVSGKKYLKRLVAIPILIFGVCAYLALDRIDRHGSIQDIAAGRVKIVEGCVTEFETNHGEPHSTKSSIPDETWSLQGVNFGYKDWSERPGYHQMEARGGVVHKGQYLRVSYIISPIFRRQEIMKIEVGSKQCG